MLCLACLPCLRRTPCFRPADRRVVPVVRTANPRGRDQPLQLSRLDDSPIKTNDGVASAARFKAEVKRAQRWISIQRYHAAMITDFSAFNDVGAIRYSRREIEILF